MEIVRNIFFVCLLLRIIEYAMPNNNYAKYIKFYGGIVIIVLILNPIVSFFLGGINIDKLIGNYTNSSRINNIKNELNSNQEKTIEKIVKPYADEIKQHIKKIVENNNMELANCKVYFCTESSDENYGGIEKIIVSVKNKYPIEQETPEAVKIIINNINKQLCSFYNLEQGNIYVTIKQV